MIMKKHTTHISGFTLVETLVAITIVTLAISGGITVAHSSIVAATSARDRLTASYLAQEGIEYVRMLRDNAYLARYPGTTSDAWSSFVGLVSMCSEWCDPLTILGMSAYVGTEFPLFTRTIKATALDATSEQIISKVSWTSRGVSQSVLITDTLTSWQ